MTMDVFAFGGGRNAFGSYLVTIGMIGFFGLGTIDLYPANMRSMGRFYPILDLYSTQAYIGYGGYIVFVVFTYRRDLRALFFGVFLSDLGFTFYLFGGEFILFLVYGFGRDIDVLMFNGGAFMDLGLTLWETHALWGLL